MLAHSLEHRRGNCQAPERLRRIARYASGHQGALRQGDYGHAARRQIERRAVEALAGRRTELERLEVFALGDEPLVMHIQGIPGIGKTHLLNALAACIGGKGVFVVRIDARWCEPSPAAFCRALCREIGAPSPKIPQW